MKARPFGIVLATALAVVGCQEEAIRRYEVPRAAAPAEAPTTGQPQVRMIVAMVPHAERTWFFKLLGPAEVVGEHKDEFDRFLQSVHFTTQGERAVEWKLPEGWKDESNAKAGGMVQRYATVRVGTGDKAAELTVNALGRDAGSLADNITRWRGQIGLKPISQKDLSQVSKSIKVDNDEGTLVDMTGARSIKMAKGMLPSNRPPVRSGPPAAPVKYATPAGWREVPATGIRTAAFVIVEGARKAEVTVMPLGREASDVLANINRWRGELKLPPIDAREAEKDVHEITVAGGGALYADLQGTGERTLAVMVPRGPQVWFIKLRGPSDLVQQQKTAFEAFVRSLEFTGGTGANHG